MSVQETHLVQSVQAAIKNMLIDTKYKDEEITFGQAIITHHFLAKAQEEQAKAHGLSTDQQPLTQSQHLQNISMSTNAMGQQYATGERGGSPVIPHQAVVQFDLIKQNLPEFKPQYGRKKLKFEEEATCVKEVFQWDDGYHESFKKLKMKELQRSPSKWQSEQRDKFRFFVDADQAMKMEKKAEEQKKPPTHITKNQEDQQETSPNGRKGTASGEQIAPMDLNTAAFSSQQQLGYPQVPEEVHNNEKEHSRKVRIKKEAFKKRAQSAKPKAKVDPTRDNYKGPTRWLPDSAFTTYFGKPAFHAYGKANLNPVYGGNIYGHYMMTHNVNPESGCNMPQYQQVYENATKYGLRKNNGERQPELPRKSAGIIGASKPSEVVVKTGGQETGAERNPIMPPEGPRTIKQKLGKAMVQTIKILRPVADKKLTTQQHSSHIQHRTLSASPDRKHKSHKNGVKSNKSNEAAQAPALYSEPHMDDFDSQPAAIRPTMVPYDQFNDVDQAAIVYSHPDFAAINENQDIGEADLQPAAIHQQEQNLLQAAQRYVPLCGLPTDRKADVKELNPRSYQFTPACWIQRIRPAGRVTYKSEGLYDILTQKNEGCEV